MKVKIPSTIKTSSPKKIGRAEKRMLCKKYHLEPEMVDRIFRDATVRYEYETFTEGSKVKLKYDRIMENAKEKDEKYLQFVKENKDKILTIKYDEGHKESPTVFCLAEDNSPQQWLFDISDLELIELNGLVKNDTMANPQEDMTIN